MFTQLEQNDTLLWPGKSGPFLINATKFWEFGLCSNDSFIIDMAVNGLQVTRTLHQMHLPILAFLDLSLRHYIAECEAGIPHARRISHYLQQVWQSAAAEIMAQSCDTLLSESWRCSALHCWASRTFYSCGHSDTGRKSYREKCAAGEIVPYSKDPIKYGMHE
jgi:hypothetical protein